MDLVIFEQRLISIPDECVRLYEEKIKPFSPEVAEYLAVTSGCTPYSSVDELQKGVISGMVEEAFVDAFYHELLYDFSMSKHSFRSFIRRPIMNSTSTLFENIDRLTVRNTDNGYRFTDTARLDRIEELLKESPFKYVKKGKLFYAFSQVPFEELDDDTVIVSSHVDFLKETKECFSDTSGENEIIGTYDNSATNAVITELMIHEKLPENTLVVFTGDEEEESGGAEEVAEFTEHLGIEAKCIVLDVTEEGYKNASFTIENAYCSDAMLEKVIKWMVGQDEDYFFVPAEEWQKTCKPVKEMIPKGFVSPNCSEADESGDYSNEDIDSISFCLPTKLMDPKGIYAPKNSGAMHSSKGLMIKKEAVRRYTAALCNLIRTCFASEDYKNQEI